MSAKQRLVDSYVDRAMQEFRHNPLARRLLRRLSDEMPTEFFNAAVRRIENGETGDGDRFMTVLMMKNPDLFEVVADPAEGVRERAVRILRKMMECDSSFDIKVARRLPDRSGLNHKEAFTGNRATRVLDVLDAVSPGRRLLPVLFHLSDSDDARISERATLFVGKRVRSIDWAEKQLAREDPRVRANAIESIWGLNTPEAVNLLTRAVSDSNNRVAGNALMGLYLLQHPGINQMVTAMASDAVPHFRATAVWMMGQMASAQFIPDLERLVNDPSADVRRAAEQAMAEIQQAIRTSEEAAAAAAASLSAEEGANEIADPTPEQPKPAFDLRLDGSSFLASNVQRIR